MTKKNEFDFVKIKFHLNENMEWYWKILNVTWIEFNSIEFFEIFWIFLMKRKLLQFEFLYSLVVLKREMCVRKLINQLKKSNLFFLCITVYVSTLKGKP
jgi:hypothetical protein